MNAAEPSRSIRPDIQGLRALAILCVVLYHARVPLFSGGYVGVDIFFVISGFLITGLLVKDLEKTGRIDFLTFYGRRIRRLLPAAMVVLVATVAVGRILLSPLEQRELAPSILSSALYFSNLWFASQATDYLASDMHTNPVLHTWSLSVEEQFYLLWPLLMLLGARAGSIAAYRSRLVLMMGIGLLLSLCADIAIIEVSQPWAFFGSPMRAWEFAAGGLIFMGNARFVKLSDVVKDAFSLTGLAAIITAVVLFDDHTRFPGLTALVPVIGTSLVVIAGAGNPARVLRCFDKPAVQAMGDLSYSWYLWHWPVLVFAATVSAGLGMADRLVCVLVSLVLAWITYTFVENRFRFSPLFAQAPLKSIVLGVCFTIAGTGSALALRAGAKSALSAPDQASYGRARDDLPKVYRAGCHASFSTVEVADCVYGDVAAGRTMVLFGDSHAAQWFPALERIAEEKRWRLVSLTKSACPSATVRLHLIVLGREYTECARWRAQVLKRLIQERPALIVLANSSGYIKDPALSVDAIEWQEGMHQTLVELQRSGASLIVLRDTPWPGFDVPICLSRVSWRGENAASCNFGRRQALDVQMYELDQKAALSLSNVAVVDIADLVCVGARCQAVVGQQVAYRDDHHLTATASAGFAVALAERFGRPLKEHD